MSPTMETFDRHGKHRWTGGQPERRRGGVYRKRPKKRHGATLRIGLVLLLIVAIGAGGGWWWYTRPAALEVAAWPEDAVITFEGIDYFGDLALEDLAPGTYTITIARKGFEPLETTFELSRLRTTELEPRLVPLPQGFALASNPSDAAYRIETSDGEVIMGETPFVGEVPAGPTTVTLSQDGYNEYVREVMVDHATDITLWMDPDGQLVHCLGVWECGPAPKGAAFSPDGSEIWVTLLGGPPSVQVFDAETLELLDELTIEGYGAVEVLFGEDGRHVYVSQMETARVYEIDASTREVTRTFETESAWSKMIEISGQRLFCSNWSGDDVSEIDLATGELVRRLPTSDTPRGLYVTKDDAYIYVCGYGTGVIDKIALADGSRSVIYDDGLAARHFAGDEASGRLFCSDMGTDEILAIDLETDEVAHFIETDAKPNTIALSPDGRILYVSSRGENNPVSYYLPGPEWGSVVLYDSATGEPLDAIVGGNQPTALAVSADGTRMVFSDFLDNRLRLFEIPPFETLSEGGGGLFGEHAAMMQK